MGVALHVWVAGGHEQQHQSDLRGRHARGRQEPRDRPCPHDSAGQLGQANCANDVENENPNAIVMNSSRGQIAAPMTAAFGARSIHGRLRRKW